MKKKAMQFLDKEFVKFFRELSKNNSRDWFQTNKKRYEQSVKQPFQELVEALLSKLEKDWDHAASPAKDYILRIHRDVRFSKDKSPYKTHVAASLSKYGRKEFGKPGMFIHANHSGIQMYSGMYMVEKNDLVKIRSALASEPKRIEKLVNAKAFRTVFGEILGDKNKRIPKEFQEAAISQPLIYNKQFYYRTEISPSDMTGKDLVRTMLKKYSAAKAINAYWEEILS